MNTATENVRAVFNTVDLAQIAQILKEETYLFSSLTRTRGVGKVWLKSFCVKYNLVELFSAWEKENRAPYQWVFSDDGRKRFVRHVAYKSIREINAQIRALQTRKREIRKALGEKWDGD
jgi:hypothetical protein